MRKRVCIVTASEITVRAFLIDHIRELSKQYDVCVITNSDDLNLMEEYDINVTNISIPIERAITPLKDLRALYLLWRVFRKMDFDLVFSVTPKSGLLSMLASFLAGMKHRVHIFTGQVWVTSDGYYRWLLKSMDMVTARCATNILVDSQSQRDFLLSEKVVTAEKSSVLANGSISGVNLARFYPRATERLRIRSEYDIPDEVVLFLFLGRLNLDKGVLDLAHAFSVLGADSNSAHLLFVGVDEGGLEAEVRKICVECQGQIHFAGYTKVPEYYMSAADVFCLPSYREGFGSVVIEAGACGLPSIGSQIYGITDSIVDGETGLLFPPGEIGTLQKHMAKFVSNSHLCQSMGKRAMERAHGLFSSGLITNELMKYYQGLLK